MARTNSARTLTRGMGGVALLLTMLAGACAALDETAGASDAPEAPLAKDDSSNAQPAGTLQARRSAPKANAPVDLDDAPSADNDTGEADEPVAPARPVARITPKAPSPNVSQITFANEGADFDPCVSPDGERIAFASTQHRSTADIYVKRTNSRTLTQLTNDPGDDVMPAFSPDGRRIAFASNRDGDWNVYVMPTTGGKAVQITGERTDELHPSWSPDGTSMVFCRLGEISGRWEMWVVDAGNPSAQTFIGYGLFPHWCPVAGSGENGADRILFQLGRDRGKRTYGIWTLEYQEGAAKNLTEIASSSDSALINPTWSVDGRWIAYAEVPVASDAAKLPQERSGASRLPHQASIWMINTDGTGKVALTSGAGASLMPAWGPDQKLYFVSNRGGSENLWAMSTQSAVFAAFGNDADAPAVAHSPSAKGHGTNQNKTSVAGANEGHDVPQKDH